MLAWISPQINPNCFRNCIAGSRAQSKIPLCSFFIHCFKNSLMDSSLNSFVIQLNVNNFFIQETLRVYFKESIRNFSQKFSRRSYRNTTSINCSKNIFINSSKTLTGFFQKNHRIDLKQMDSSKNSPKVSPINYFYDSPRKFYKKKTHELLIPQSYFAVVSFMCTPSICLKNPNTKSSRNSTRNFPRVIYEFFKKIFQKFVLELLHEFLSMHICTNC